MTNFFRDQRFKLGLTLTQMAARVDSTAATVLNWEQDEVNISKPIAMLSTGYEVSQSRMEKEVMALRRRIESRKASELVSSK